MDFNVTSKQNGVREYYVVTESGIVPEVRPHHESYSALGNGKWDAGPALVLLAMPGTG